jgi:hypothetical protein
VGLAPEEAGEVKEQEASFLDALKAGGDRLGTSLAYRDWLTDELRNLDAEALRRTMESPKLNAVEDLKGLFAIYSEDDGDFHLLLADGRRCRLHNSEEGTGNDCSVWLEDVSGTLEDLVASEILQAEECTGESGPDKGDESFTWTFYRFATRKGAVTLRFYGTSNGYYSESASFEVTGGARESQ